MGNPLSTVKITLVLALLVGLTSLVSYIVSGEPGWKWLSAVSGCTVIVCCGYLMGRLDA